jgi:hypothetical protein
MEFKSSLLVDRRRRHGRVHIISIVDTGRKGVRDLDREPDDYYYGLAEQMTAS